MFIMTDREQTETLMNIENAICTLQELENSVYEIRTTIADLINKLEISERNIM